MRGSGNVPRRRKPVSRKGVIPSQALPSCPSSSSPAGMSFRSCSASTRQCANRRSSQLWASVQGPCGSGHGRCAVSSIEDACRAGVRRKSSALIGPPIPDYPPIMRWEEFAAAAPELAALGEERLRGRELCLVGTLRANGWPRISPVEPDFVDGELMLGMMWRSPKALDLLRDPRLVVHSVVSRREGDEGDFKLYGRAVPVDQGERRENYRAAIKARIDWEPEEPDYHVFAVDIDSAGFVEFAPGRYGLAWDPDGGLPRWQQRES